MQYIVDNLFVGNKLSTAEITTDDGKQIDLRNIQSPIICFCSKGDNITPPQQALGWIPDLYESVDEIRAAGQTIVYAVHEKIGHLGIFVSSTVASKEHQEFAENIDFIDCLPPGLYEAVIEEVGPDAANPDLINADHISRFEARTPADILAMATMGGAKALNVDDRYGSLAPGKSAEFLAVPLSGEIADEKMLYEALLSRNPLQPVWVKEQ